MFSSSALVPAFAAVMVAMVDFMDETSCLDARSSPSSVSRCRSTLDLANSRSSIFCWKRREMLDISSSLILY